MGLVVALAAGFVVMLGLAAMGLAVAASGRLKSMAGGVNGLITGS
jgi:hypothetical protein